ncbi:hypothetical protein BBP40_010929 [Aspergillus hancockii]|nr:hypothetical protein BBP40_010929 [Aspergillus hancockii]
MDAFSHQGPNGTRECLVSKLLGPSVDMVLSDYQEAQDGLNPEIVLRLLQQLLEAIKSIHNTGMCHEVLGAPEIELLVRVDDEDKEKIRLLDLGESFVQGEEPKKLAHPDTLRVPEIIFTDTFNYRVYLWRTGCMVTASI